MRSVSSDFNKERISQLLSDKAANSKVRLLMLLEPGKAMIEGCKVQAERWIDWVIIMLGWPVVDDNGSLCQQFDGFQMETSANQVEKVLI